MSCPAGTGAGRNRLALIDRKGNNMSGKSKALGLGLVATLAIAAIASVSASAEVTGHFIVEGGDANLVGTENATHNSQFSVEGGTPIECLNDSYEGFGGSETLAGFTLVPKYPTCKTAGAANHEVTITPNGCRYTLKATEKVHATFWILCPEGKPMEIHHPNCTITIQEQNLSAVSYTTLLENTKHALTVNLTVENITAHYHGGACIFLGTTHKGALKGSFTIKALDTAGKQVNLTVT